MIVISGVGSGLSAKAAFRAGVDSVACYSTARYRVQGLPTSLSFLPYDDCNQVTLDLLPEVRAAVDSEVPVIAGVGAHDPRIDLAGHLRKLKELGATGVMNEPFLGIYGPEIQRSLSDAGLGFEREIELLALAKDVGMMTLGWAFTPEEACKLGEIGVTWVGAMAGIMGESVPSEVEIQSCIRHLSLLRSAARGTDPDVKVLGHGGVLNDPFITIRVVQDAGLDGVVTGSNGERVPASRGIEEALSHLVLNLGKG